MCIRDRDTYPTMNNTQIRNTLASFLSEGRFEQHLSRARNRYRALRDQVLEALEAGTLSMDTIDTACRRVLTWKQALGLLE